MLPNFLVIGAAKCGSSSLCNGLREHPEVFMSMPKEPYYFSHDSVYQKGMDWYESFFDEAEGFPARGEGSTSYTQHAAHPHTAERVRRGLGQPRLIYIVRHPLSQIESHWVWLRTFRVRHKRRGVYVSDDFNADLHNEPLLLDACSYWHQISFYRQFVDDSRILVLFFEDFVNDPEDQLKRCFEFLEVDPNVPSNSANTRANPSSVLWSDRKWSEPLRAIGLTPRVRQLTPAGLRPALRQILKRKSPPKPSWDTENRAWVTDQVQGDARRILEYAGKSVDFWSFA